MFFMMSHAGVTLMLKEQPTKLFMQDTTDHRYIKMLQSMLPNVINVNAWENLLK
jgi:hypothetical protein